MILTLLVLSSFAPASQGQDTRYFIGLLREDGILAPRAVFEGGRWKELSHADFSWVADYKPTWYLESDSSQAIRTWSKVIFEPDGMNSGVGFISSYHPPEFGSRYSNVLNVGMVSTWIGSEVVPFYDQPIELRRADSISVVARLRELESNYVDRATEAMYTTDDHGTLLAGGLPADPNTRDSLVVEVDVSGLKYAIDGLQISIVRARRMYPDVGCGMRTILQEWLIRREMREAIFAEQEFVVDDCDGKMSPSLKNPHVAFTFQDKVFLITHEWYYEGEGGGIYRVNDERVALEVQW